MYSTVEKRIWEKRVVNHWSEDASCNVRIAQSCASCHQPIFSTRPPWAISVLLPLTELALQIPISLHISWLQFSSSILSPIKSHANTRYICSSPSACIMAIQPFWNQYSTSFFTFCVGYCWYQHGRSIYCDGYIGKLYGEFRRLRGLDSTCILEVMRWDSFWNLSRKS